MSYKIYNLVVLAAMAILAATQGSVQVNALSIEHGHLARHSGVGHGAVFKREAETNMARVRRRGRCQTSPSAPSFPAPSSPGQSSPPAEGQPPQQQQPSPPPPTVSSPPTTPNPPPTEGQPPQEQQPAPPADEQPPQQQEPAPPTSNPPPSNGSKKAGIAWNNPNHNELLNFLVGKVSAVYTWHPYKLEVLNNRPDIEFIPMLWNEKQLDDFYKFVKPGYARHILGFNEPDQSRQANMDPYHAVNVWMQHIQPLKSQGYTLISPACTNAPDGLQWMQDFMRVCGERGCTVDIIATHWYGTSSQSFINHVQNYHNIFNKEIWVTEFACQNFGGGAQCTTGEIFEFMRTVTDWMDNTWYVGKYFAFGVLHDMFNVNYANQLINGRGQPTDLGFEYLY